MGQQWTLLSIYGAIVKDDTNMVLKVFDLRYTNGCSEKEGSQANVIANRNPCVRTDILTRGH